MLKWFSRIISKLVGPFIMDSKTVVTEIMRTYGEKPEGFDEYLETCNRIEPYLTPNSIPEICIAYECPEGIILHDIMMQPFFQRDMLKARENDIVIVGFPKTGTSWMQEICYTVSSKGDLSKAKTKPLSERTTYLEIPLGGLKAIENNKAEQRIFKSHLPYHLLHKSFIENKSKILYVTRNPKDTFVSAYFFYKNLKFTLHTGTMDDFFEHFLNENVLYSSFANNVLSYWNRRHEENVCFITYEELQKDSKNGIKKISDFLGQDLSDEQLDAIVHHTCFEQMAENPMTNYSADALVYKHGSIFMRKGKVGDWKNYFDEEMNRKMDEYNKKHFEGTGLEFEYEI